MAQIINRKSPKIIDSIRARGYSFISVKKKGLFFSKPAAQMCGVSSDKFIHFINDFNYWAFYINDNPDGFVLTFDHDGRSGFIVYSTQLSRLFIKSTGKKLNERFFINDTKSEHNGNPLWEIQTLSSIDVIVDRIQKMNDQKIIERQYVLNISEHLRRRKKEASLQK